MNAIKLCMCIFIVNYDYDFVILNFVDLHTVITVHGHILGLHVQMPP